MPGTEPISSPAAEPSATASALPSPSVVPSPTDEEVAAEDLAVCDAYQHLIDIWPADSDGELTDSAAEIYLAIEQAGTMLEDAGQSASDPELARIGQSVGEAAIVFIEMDETAREIGFIPYFGEEYIGGEELSQICEGLGKEIMQR